MSGSERDWGTTEGMAEMMWHRRETRRKRRKQTSACNQREAPVYSTGHAIRHSEKGITKEPRFLLPKAMRVKEHLCARDATINQREPVWPAGFCNFNVFSGEKEGEIRVYVHPVRKRPVEQAEESRDASARWHLLKASGGLEIVNFS